MPHAVPATDQLRHAGVGMPVNAVATAVEPIFSAIALAIQPVLDAVTLAVHVCGGLLMAAHREPVGALVQTPIDAFATVVETCINALAAPVETLIDAVAAIFGQHRGSGQQSQQAGGQNGCGFHFSFLSERWIKPGPTCSITPA
jgi:hypothetical protein